MMPAAPSLLTAGLVLTAVAHGVAVLLVMMEHRRSRGHRTGGLVLSLGTGSLAASVVSRNGAATGLVVALVLAGMVVGFRRMHRFLVSGVLLCVTYLPFMAFTLLWSAWFVTRMPVSPLTRGLMLAGAPLVVLGVPVTLVRTFENWEVLCRRDWLRPRQPLFEPDRSQFPRVSVHVPAHAEPPDVVIATLDCLARLEYPNFEVLVVDNNTTEPDLWRPVEAHCAGLGERFRFLHVEGITGAKAGALNFALAHTGCAAELIAVVDADYQVEPDFLAGTVGYFEDPAMGFVQSPHAHRKWEDSTYLRLCNFEYAYFFVTGMVSVNERDAAITVGTMCVIRRQALEEAGGWAEWCLTEDSELAVRIHALGYSSVYLTHIYGRGLIPQTFAGYKQQRFRWTYGPVQEVKHHFRLYLPRRWRRPSCLSWAQRLHHMTHGLQGIGLAAGVAGVPLALGVIASMVAHGEVIPLPFPLWLAATVLLGSSFLQRWLAYRVVLGTGVGETLGALLATASLTHVVVVANVWALVGRHAPWTRTDKFCPGRQRAAKLGGARTELIAGLFCLGSAGTALAVLPQRGFATMLAVGIVLQGLPYLAAPAMAVLAQRDLHRHVHRDRLETAPARTGVRLDVP